MRECQRHRHFQGQHGQDASDQQEDGEGEHAVPADEEPNRQEQFGVAGAEQPKSPKYDPEREEE